MSIVMIVSNMIECYYGIPRPGVPLLRLLLLLVPSVEIPGYEVLSFCAPPTILYVPKEDMHTAHQNTQTVFEQCWIQRVRNH